MSDAATISGVQAPNWVQLSTQDPIAFLKNLDDLMDEFGPEQLSNAATRQLLERFGESLKQQIDASDLPPVLKDMAKSVIDAHLGQTREQCPCSAEASEAVSNCAQSEQIDQAADEAVAHCCNHEESSSSTEDTCTSTASETSEATEASSGTEELSPEEAAEAATEAENEGTHAPTYDGSDTAADAALAMQESDDEKKNGKGNWLEILAKNLADIQSKFLDKALEASSKMSAEADNVAPGGDGSGGGDSKSAAFLEAQALFTANMQMFNLFANQSATALKTIGEGLAAIARKQ